MSRPERFGLPPDTDLAAFLLALPPEARAEAVATLGAEEREAFDRDWSSWAHEGQAFPPGDWTTWVVKGGRGFGKTLTGSHWVTAAIATGEPLDIALVGATLEDARRVMVEGRSGLIEVAGAWISDWHPSLHRLRFRTGATATLFSGASPEQLRGPEHHLAWCDELAKWEKPQATWDMLQFGLRLGERPRVLVTTTPRPGPVLTAIMAAPGTIVTGGPSSANPHNSEAWRRAIYARYAGTRLGRQELDGELIADRPGALWTVELLERCRILPGTGARSAACPGDRRAPQGEAWGTATRSGEVEGGPCQVPNPLRQPAAATSPSRGGFTRIVVAVDPPALDGTCGIVACARDEEGKGHVLADHSVTARSPDGWARAVADAARIHSHPPRDGEGDRDAQRRGGGGPATLPVLVVAERNQGGRMVEAILRTADPKLRVKPVTATVPKAERAAPVAMLFEAGRVTLHGRFPELEAELCGIIAGGEYEGPGISPDRADAMVWALTELMLQPERGEPRIRVL